ncbi:MAG: triose-phosphate isomerase, partial [Phycisphaerae bacterium]
IIGHSERRQLFGETNDQLSEKVVAGMKAGLTVIYCVGEKLEEREAGSTNQVVSSQVREGLHGDIQAEKLVIAYEPVWAIGTGKTASPEQAQEVHQLIRGELEQRFDASAAASTRILYGGSVKPANAAELMAQADIDGALVGGASLAADDFLAIMKAAKG